MTQLDQLYNQKLLELTNQNSELMNQLERQEREFLNQLRTQQQRYENSMKQIVTSYQEALMKLSKSEAQNMEILGKKLTELENQIAIISENQKAIYNKLETLNQQLADMPDLKKELQVISRLHENI